MKKQFWLLVGIGIGLHALIWLDVWTYHLVARMFGAAE